MIGAAMRDGLHSLQNFSSDDILSALGLERRRHPVTGVILPSVALFAAGAVVGAAAAMLLAPKTGEAMRRDLTNGARDLGNRLGATAQAVQEYVGSGRSNSSNHVSSATTP